jgi:hypothetical protein
MAMLQSQHTVEGAWSAGADREHDSTLRQEQGEIARARVGVRVIADRVSG